ncbi:MAG: hypothetical protein JST93_16205 [Acidobacteria bacterium]|nr:hypothetical protein [Acidobacteriota bacterium]
MNKGRCLAILIALPVFAQSTKDIVLLGESSVRLEKDAGTATLELRNTGGADLHVDLSSTKCGHAPDARLQAEFLDETQKPIRTVIMKQDTVAAITLKVTAIAPFAGSVALPICSGRELIATVPVISWRDLKPVKVEGEKPVLQSDGSLPLLIRNEDPTVTYHLRWRMQHKNQNAEGVLRILPSSSEPLTLNHPGFLGSDWTTLFANQKKELPLSIGLHIAGPQEIAPLRIPVEVRAQTARIGFPEALTAGLLFIGSFFAIFLFNYIPNRRRQQQLLSALGALGQDVGSLSTTLQSQSRVAVGVERNRIKDLLRGRIATSILARFIAFLFRQVLCISPDFVQVMDQCEADIRTLKQRVQLLTDIDGSLRRFHELKGQGLPPSLVEQVKSPLEQVLDLLIKQKPSAEELARAQLLATQVINTVASFDLHASPAPSEEVRNHLKDNLTLVKATFANPHPALQKELPGLFTALTVAEPNSIAAGLPFLKFAELDWLVHKFLILQRYETYVAAQASQAATAATATGGSVAAPAPRPTTPVDQELFESLRCTSWEQLAHADMLVSELEQDVSVSDLTTAMQLLDENAIDIDRVMVRQNEAVTLRVKIDDPRFQTAKARQRIQCKWSFLYKGDTKPLHEFGWEISHYFAKPGDYEIKVAFSCGAAHGDIGPRTITVFSREFSALGPRLGIEFVRILITLGIALAGLMTGAKDKLDQFGVWGSATAIIAAGFTADSVRRILASNGENRPVT